MRPDARDASYLLDMVEAAERVRSYVSNATFAQYEESSLLRDAVERNVVVMGEAAKKVSEAFRREHPEIPWRKMAVLRNVLAHEYGAISNSEIWEVATMRMNAFIQALKPLIPPPPED